MARYGANLKTITAFGWPETIDNDHLRELMAPLQNSLLVYESLESLWVPIEVIVHFFNEHPDLVDMQEFVENNNRLRWCIGRPSKEWDEQEFQTNIEHVTTAASIELANRINGRRPYHADEFVSIEVLQKLLDTPKAVYSNELLWQILEFGHGPRVLAELATRAFHDSLEHEEKKMAFRMFGLMVEGSEFPTALDQVMQPFAVEGSDIGRFSGESLADVELEDVVNEMEDFFVEGSPLVPTDPQVTYARGYIRVEGVIDRDMASVLSRISQYHTGRLWKVNQKMMEEEIMRGHVEELQHFGRQLVRGDLEWASELFPIQSDAEVTFEEHHDELKERGLTKVSWWRNRDLNYQLSSSKMKELMWCALYNPAVELWMDYEDNKLNVTRRRIAHVNQISETNFTAWCHLRGAPRTFSYSNVQRLFPAEF